MGIGRYVKVVKRDGSEIPIIISVFTSIYIPTSGKYMDIFAPSSELAINEFKQMGADEEHLRKLEVGFEDISTLPNLSGRQVVLFSPGIGVDRDLNTYLIEGLVASGHVVVTIGHLFDTLFTLLPDGSLYYQEEHVRTVDFTNVKELKGLLEKRVQDIGIVMDELQVSDFLDISSVIGIGHSLGGAAMIEAAKKDSRFKAVASLDGSLHLVDREEEIHFPLLNLRQDAASYEEMKGSMKVAREYAAGQKAIYDICKNGKAFYKVKGADHMSFTDIPLLFNPETQVTKRIHDSIKGLVVRFTGDVIGNSSLTLYGAENIIKINELGEEV